jgi:hypothetical protein
VVSICGCFGNYTINNHLCKIRAKEFIGKVKTTQKGGFYYLANYSGVLEKYKQDADRNEKESKSDR